MWRLLHWGPLLALAIIKLVSLCTLFYFGQWAVPLTDWRWMFNLALYSLLIATTLYNFFSAIFNGPGYVRSGWRPDNADDEKFLQYCYKCESFKAPRSHHCSRCQQCVLKMDHHCPWINNCCGYRNQKSFFYFLLSAVIGSVHSIALLAITLYRALYFIPNAHHRYIHLSLQGFFVILISMGMSLGVIIAVGSLLFLQARILVRNRTSIEDWIVTKANMRKRKEPFVFPYNLGLWANIRQVLFEPLGDGITWPVIKGCDQYTLTREQILQKQDKMRNSARFRAVSSYNGRFFPMFSQGCKVCLTFPINDDNRLPLEIGDELFVTHNHKRWLYGMKLNGSKIPPKGWFPAQCVTLVIASTHDRQQQFMQNRDEPQNLSSSTVKKNI